MVSAISLLIILTLSILITRIGTVALTLTGLSRDSARFQARSAFLGVGFTTSESESVVSHLVRRKILLILMLLGNAGIITAISSLILTFINLGATGSIGIKLALLASGLVMLWVVGTSRWVDRHLSTIISWALNRYTQLEVHDFASLLDLAGDYRVTEHLVKEKSWVAHERLSELKLRDEGISILGVTHEGGKYIGVPKGHTKIIPGDILILYGRSSALENLDRRLKGNLGNREHEVACTEQRRFAEDERMKDETRRSRR
jgi:hypothetical protein